MRVFRLIFWCIWVAVAVSCASSTKHDETVATVDNNSPADDIHAENPENVDLINMVYEKFVFAIDSDEAISPEMYFTANALKKLQDDYEFDCIEGTCYAYYALRTDMQDSNPESDESSRVYGIEPDGDGWYTVSYSDMGWAGKTRIKIVDGKIDDYQSLK